MKHDLNTGTWQDDTGCPISIILAATPDDSSVDILVLCEMIKNKTSCAMKQPVHQSQPALSAHSLSS